MQPSQNKPWHLARLFHQDGTYYPAAIESYATYEEGTAEQRRLGGQGVETSLSNSPAIKPYTNFRGIYGDL